MYLRWRAAFYIAGIDGCVLNFMNLLDDFLVWKVKSLRKEVEARVRFGGVLCLICSSFYFCSGIHLPERTERN